MSEFPQKYCVDNQGVHCFCVFIYIRNKGFLGEDKLPKSVPKQRHLLKLAFLNKYAVLFYSSFILLLSSIQTDHLISIIVFNYNYLNPMTILLCHCFYSLYYYFSKFWILFVIMICTHTFYFISNTTLMKKSYISKYICQ